MTPFENGSLNDLNDNNDTVPYPRRDITNSILPVKTYENGSLNDMIDKKHY